MFCMARPPHGRLSVILLGSLTTHFSHMANPIFPMYHRMYLIDSLVAATKTARWLLLGRVRQDGGQPRDGGVSRVRPRSRFPIGNPTGRSEIRAGRIFC